MSMTKESFSSAAGRIRIDVYSPQSGGKHPAVLILHGTAGLDAEFGPDIVSFAEALTKKGIAAEIPHYFESTGTPAGKEAYKRIFEKLPDWKTACGAARAFMAADTRFDATRMGVIGFSLGGHLALSLAMDRAASPKFKAVVDFFGPTLEPKLEDHWSALPPVLIHHGTADPLSIENSRYLVRKLEAAGRTVTPLVFGKPAQGPATDYQFIEYPDEGHGFKGAALAGSLDSTIQFLDTHLK